MSMTPTIETLQSLLSRVRRAKGQDRELDADLCIALSFIGDHVGPVENLARPDDWGSYDELNYDLAGEECCDRCPAITSSIDAALALVKRSLPGKRVVLCCDEFDYGSCEIRGKRGPHNGPLLGCDERLDDSAPLAILAALLSALIAQAREAIPPKAQAILDLTEIDGVIGS